MEPSVRLIPLGGLGEIGLNMMLVESGDDLLAVDCGLMFPDDELPGIDHVIPDFSYALARRDGFRGVLLTHGHEDHIGALPYLLREAPVPVYGTPMTLALVGERLREHGLLESADLRPMRPRARFDLGPFGIEPIRVTHSIVDGIGLAIQTPIDLGVEHFDLGVGQIEERAGDIFARVIDDVADPALPVFAEDRKAHAIVVQHRGPARLEVGASHPFTREVRSAQLAVPERCQAALFEKVADTLALDGRGGTTRGSRAGVREKRCHPS